MTDHSARAGADSPVGEIETGHQVDIEKDLRFRARIRNALRLASPVQGRHVRGLRLRHVAHPRGVRSVDRPP